MFGGKNIQPHLSHRSSSSNIAWMFKSSSSSASCLCSRFSTLTFRRPVLIHSNFDLQSGQEFVIWNKNCMGLEVCSKEEPFHPMFRCSLCESSGHSQIKRQDYLPTVPSKCSTDHFFLSDHRPWMSKCCFRPAQWRFQRVSFRCFSRCFSRVF